MAAPVFRMYREGDEVEINRVFEQVSGLLRSLDEWAWLYPPEVDGRIIVVAETGGEMVAHCAGTPLRVAVDGREPAAVRIDDLLSLAPGDEFTARVAETFFERFGSSGRFPLVVACPQLRDDRWPPGTVGRPDSTGCRGVSSRLSPGTVRRDRKPAGCGTAPSEPGIGSRGSTICGTGFAATTRWRLYAMPRALCADFPATRQCVTSGS